LKGIAEAQVISGGIVKRRLIAYFIGNIYAKKYQNPFMCVKVIASQMWDVFCDTVYMSNGLEPPLLALPIALSLRIGSLKPNSITFAGSKLVRS